MRDWNAVVGEGRDGREVEEFGLGKRNDRGQALIDFCKRSKLIVTHTWFQHERRKDIHGRDLETQEDIN